jgi:hypothetical protein
MTAAMSRFYLKQVVKCCSHGEITAGSVFTLVDANHDRLQLHRNPLRSIYTSGPTVTTTPRK